LSRPSLATQADGDPVRLEQAGKLTAASRFDCSVLTTAGRSLSTRKKEKIDC